MPQLQNLGYFDHISEFESMDLEDAEEMIQLYQ